MFFGHAPKKDDRITSYRIIRFPHPSSGKPEQVMQSGLTLRKAEAHCKSPESSYKEGPEEEWWFEGYAQDNGRPVIPLWKALEGGSV